MADSSLPVDISVREVDTPQCGKVKVYVQGNLAERQGKTVFVTCHDMGTNFKSFLSFIGHQSMEEVRQRSIFLHLCVPGQEDHATALPADFAFPTLDQIGQDVVCVLDHFGVKTVIGFGEGAGANVICRFAIHHPNRCLGIVLVHCTSTTAGVLEYIKDKVINWKLGSVGMNETAWEYLVFHKFGPRFCIMQELYDPEGNSVKNENSDPRTQHVRDYLADLKQRLNPNNLAKYLDSFLKRSDLSSVLAQKLKMDALLVVGSKASHIHTVYTMHQAMSKPNTTLLVVDDVGDVMNEAPSKLARAMILFCKGCGVLSGVSIPGMERQRTLSSSMEEADKPRRMSLSAQASQQHRV